MKPICSNSVFSEKFQAWYCVWFALLAFAIGQTYAIAQSRSIETAWSGYAHTAQHTALSPAASQPLNRILWQTPVDLAPVYNGGDLFIHYGTPLITRSNTLILPVKTGISGSFRLQAHSTANGHTNWLQSSDYLLPPSYNWTPSFSGTLTPKNRLYFPGGGGTVFYCDNPDASNAAPTFGRLAFYGLTNYLADTNGWRSRIYICSPITSDRYGNIFFGFQVTVSNSLNILSGIARIDANGTGSWINAVSAVTNGTATQAAFNCAPALANDHRTLYVAVNTGYPYDGYLVALDSRTLAPLANVHLKDVQNPGLYAAVYNDATSSPTVGPDGDVYFGVLEQPFYSNHGRGWLLHFDSTLATNKIPGSFGWDDTASIVPANMVPSYHGASKYLLMTKYNNYVEGIGDGLNRIAILDPQDTQISPITGSTVMREVLTMLGPTPDYPNRTSATPNAVREWCINTACVDPATKSVLVNNEDGVMYRWDLTSNTLSQSLTITAGVGEAYTPTIVGLDGVVYAINNATLFALGR